jgi:hypothetical protein
MKTMGEYISVLLVTQAREKSYNKVGFAITIH